jgi:calcium-dependent protein kinase
MAEEQVTKELVALKILPKDADHRDSKLLWSTEVKIMQHLDHHPNIVSFVDAWEDDEGYKIVTKLCTGGELFDRISEGSFSEAVAASLTRQLLLALNHCHERHIMHRDLKPENLIFETKKENSSMKLIDFGCAVMANDQDVIADVAGSPYYVAPEVLESNRRRTGEIWKKADMWSVGVIVFLLVHGYPPFNGESQEEIFRRIRAGKYTFSRKIPLSRSVQDLVSKLLVKAPLERLSAAEALRHPWISQAGEAPDTPLNPEIVRSLKGFQVQCKLKKAVGRAMAARMLEADKDAIAQLFKKFDKNGDGKLSGDEIAEMMRSIGRNPAEMKQLMSDADQNNDGTIDQKEFQQMIATGELSQKEKAENAFRTFDTDGSGAVDVAELRAFFPDMPERELKKLIQEVDKNGDGQISMDEWVAAMGAMKPK